MSSRCGWWGIFGPDVLGVQEALRFQLDEIGAAFPHLGEVDVGRDRHPDAAVVGTFNEFEGTSTGERIDAILASPGWHTRAAAIVRSHDVGPDRARYPSDHFRVTAVLDYP